MNVKTETSIRALKKYRDHELFKILAEYHERVREVEDRIEEIRKLRGTKIRSDWGEEDIKRYWAADGRYSSDPTLGH